MEPPFAWKQIAEPLEPFLQSVAGGLGDQVAGFDPELRRLAGEALSSQGKQLRPVLVGLSGRALGKLSAAHVTVAVIIEMVHLATLVHDDVLDEARVRRGRPTLAAHWGNEVAVLLGDCLFAHALVLAAGFPTTEICRAVAQATNTVCAGEILQTRQRRNFQFSQAEYFKVLGMKTGELFALACDLGAHLGKATPARRAALREFGLNLGIAYQIYDDCVDLFATETAAGKSLGTDLAKGKLTLPVLLLLERLPAPAKKRLQEMIENWSPRHLQCVQQWLAAHETLADSRRVLDQYLAAARKQLACLPDGAGRARLAALTDFLGQQARTLGSEG